jgi:hypothetical protein
MVSSRTPIPEQHLGDELACCGIFLMGDGELIVRSRRLSALPELIPTTRETRVYADIH